MEASTLLLFPVVKDFFSVRGQHVWEHLCLGEQLFNSEVDQVNREKAGRQNYYINGSCNTVCSSSALLLLETVQHSKIYFSFK